MYQRNKMLISVEDAKQIHLNVQTAQVKPDYDRHIQEILFGRSGFLLVIGPCSADDPSAVMRYCEQLKRISEKTSDTLFITPRIYTTKPRSKAGAYRGMLHSPDFYDNDISKGILKARRLMVDVAENFGFFAADEMLYPELYDHFDDLLSYVTIGARSADSQLHRMAASALGVAVGIKNPIGGDLKSLAQAISIARSSNCFSLGGYEIVSDGNPFAHAILRGYTDSNGNMHTNYGNKSVEKLLCECESLGFDVPVLIDCNHGNSGKNGSLEPKVALSAVKEAKEIKNIRGLMIESYIYDGRQDYPQTAGVSLTDDCIGLRKTEKLIYKIAELL